MSHGTLPPVVADALSQPGKGVKQQSRPLPVIPVKKEREPGAVATALVEVPVGELDSKFPNGRIDVHLGDDHSKKLRRVLNGLKDSNAKMKDGNQPRSVVDVIRWFLDQIE